MRSPVRPGSAKGWLPRVGRKRKGMAEKKLYGWQQDCLRLWFENGCRGVAGVATGAGKTHLALEAAARLRETLPGKTLRVRIIVPQVFLAHQWKSEIASFFGMHEREIGLWFGGRKDSPDRPFMVYVLNSARYCVSRHILSDIHAGDPVFLICDEAHHFGSKENAHVFDFVPQAKEGDVYSLGLSATPESERFKDVIAPAIGPLFFRYGIEEATRHCITAPYKLFHVSVPFLAEEQAEYDILSDRIAWAKAALLKVCPNFFSTGLADHIRKLDQLIRGGGKAADAAARLKSLYFQRKHILVFAESRVECGLELGRLLTAGQKTIFFTERIATANRLFEGLSSLFPGKAGLYHSAMHPNQKSLSLERYREGRTRMLVCCRALDEGLNVPDTEAAVVISSSAGELQRIQRIGRVLRKTPGNIPKRIFYLYVPTTAESPEYLPGSGAYAEKLYFDVVPGSVRPEGRGDGAAGSGDRDVGDVGPGGIRCLEYDRLAGLVMGRLVEDGASEKQVSSAKSQIDKGRIAADWRLPSGEIEKRLEELKHASSQEKNYWTTMLLLARAGESKAEIRSR